MTTMVTPSLAIQPVPTQIIEDSVTPDCLSIQASNIFLGGKSPALKLINNCPTSLFIAEVSTSRTSQETVAPLKKAYTFLYYVENDIKVNKDIILANDTSCQSVEKEVARENKKRKEEDKNFNADPTDPLYEWRKTLPPIASEEQEFSCAGLMLPQKAELTMSMPWDTYFLITGNYIKRNGLKDEEQPVSIEGHMINPTRQRD